MFPSSLRLTERLRIWLRWPGVRLAVGAANADPARSRCHAISAFRRAAAAGQSRATSMTGLSAIGAAAILAETGDPRRFATGRAVVKQAGLAPREKLSGAFTGRTRLTGQGRPGLRLAAWRAAWGAQRANPVYAARYQHLTSREQNKLTPTQAQTVIAAAILRQLHAIITTGQAWDPATAAHGARRESTPQAA